MRWRDHCCVIHSPGDVVVALLPGRIGSSSLSSWESAGQRVSPVVNFLNSFPIGAHPRRLFLLIRVVGWMLVVVVNNIRQLRPSFFSVAIKCRHVTTRPRSVPLPGSCCCSNALAPSSNIDQIRTTTTTAAWPVFTSP